MNQLRVLDSATDAHSGQCRQKGIVLKLLSSWRLLRLQSQEPCSKSCLRLVLWRCHCDTSAEAVDAAGAGVLLNRICHSFSGSSPEAHPTDEPVLTVPSGLVVWEAKKVCFSFHVWRKQISDSSQTSSWETFKRKGVQMLVGHRES